MSQGPTVQHVGCPNCTVSSVWSSHKVKREMPSLIHSSKRKDKHITVIFLKQDYKKKINNCINPPLETFDSLALEVSFQSLHTDSGMIPSSNNSPVNT